jgi:uncharacterized membrane protein
MKRYSVLICLLLELCVNPCFAQSDATAPAETVVQSFTLLRAGSSAKILWQTSTEKNNNYFEVQRSSDGEKFTAVALVFAHENAPNGADYMYIDHTVSMAGADSVFYRIRQVDMEGKSTFTEARKFRVPDTKVALH